ncbi:MAG: hypothetical protein HY22_11705 [[Candidatus Thermochlorobacteriaceae] bacterium GBChlB]|nr:MAG: hypothetical protein HY22_11705 [[Candidatus Thermochlorobacteriaceae] bacterium GBChlB]
MKIIVAFFFVFFLAIADSWAQQKSPCNDSLYLRLKAVPRVSLTQSERKYIDQKEQECADFKAGAAMPKVMGDSSRADDAKAVKKIDSQPDAQKALAIDVGNSVPPAETDSLRLKQESQDEPILSGRNIGIFAVILVAIVGLTVALGGVTPAPF